MAVKSKLADMQLRTHAHDHMHATRCRACHVTAFLQHQGVFDSLRSAIIALET